MNRSTALIALGGVGLFAAAAAAAALVSDAVSSRDEYVVAEPVAEYPVASFEAANLAADRADPGAVIAPVLVPAPPPLLPEEPPDPAYDDTAGPSSSPATTAATAAVGTTTHAPPTSATGTVDSGGSATPSAPTTDPAAPSTAVSPATPNTSTTSPAPIGAGGGQPDWGNAIIPSDTGTPQLDAVFRFRDLCADAATSACPPGLGATVLLTGGSAPPPPLEIDILVDPTQAIRNQVRCDLAWPSSTSIPVLITSNRPLDLYHSALSLTDGRPVDEVNNGRSEPGESTWYDQRVTSGQVVGTAVGDAVQTCVSFDLDSAFAVADVDRNGRFEIEVVGFAGQSSDTRTVRFDGNFRVGRPPVRVLPLDGYRAMMIVPQRRDDVVSARLYGRWEGIGDPGVGRCPPAGTPVYWGDLTRRSPAQGPTAYSPADLDAPDYPFDRDYTHYTVWDLYLQDGTDYRVCVDWQLDDANEHLVVETPAAWRFILLGRELNYKADVDKGSLVLHLLGIKNCYVANPGQDSVGGRDPFPELHLTHTSGWESWYLPDPALCNSKGWRLPEVVEVRSGLSALGDNTVYGVAQIPIDVLVRDCRSDAASGTVSSADGCAGPTIEWRNQNVLCGGPWGNGDCQGDLFLSLTTQMQAYGDSRYIDPDPKAWSVTRVVRLADAPSTRPVDEVTGSP